MVGDAIAQGGPNNHWTLVGIYPKRKQICYYDSLLMSGDSICSNLLRYVQDEYADKKRQEMPNRSSWTIRDIEVPRQRNNYDCGVFVCAYAYCIVTGQDFEFTEADMPSWRAWIATCIKFCRIPTVRCF